MIREAVQQDAKEIEWFLAKTPETTMFLRSNLSHGVGWTDHPHSTRYFLWITRAGIEGVFGLTRGGFLLAQTSVKTAEPFVAFSRAIVGESVVGMTGGRDCVVATLEHLGFDKLDFRLQFDEPLMRADLSRLSEVSAVLRRPSEADRKILLEWFVEYELETGLSRGRETAQARAAERFAASLDDVSDLVFMIDEGGSPVAMADFNARLPDTVQVGGVFVPKRWRNKGYGRRVTAGLLKEVREQGVRTAILFASGAAAQSCYQAIGFKVVGEYRVALLEAPEMVGETA